jgi:hypothetical protein
MLRIIAWLLLLWALKVAWKVWWAIVYWIAEILKRFLLLWFLYSFFSMFDWNFLPIIIFLWVPIGGIAWVIYLVKKRLNPKKEVEKKIVWDAEVIDVD